VNLNDVVKKIQRWSGITVGFTCGSFDLLHTGHTIMLRECKDHCNYLIVGLQSDPSIDRPEKNKPIQSYEERKTMLESIRYVDEIITYHTEADLEKLLKNLIDNKQIDLRIIGEDWHGKRFTGDKLDIPVIFNKRKHTYSSSNLRERVYQAEYLLRRDKNIPPT
jgi:glycerol-3-phosphate cytidylyltransferase